MDRRAAYERDGFYIAKGLFSPDEIASISQAVKRDTGAIGATGVKVFDAPEAPASLLDACLAPRMVDIVKQIIGSEAVFLGVKPVIKNPAVPSASPWHQDYAYWGGKHKLSAWMALDDARVDNGCLRIVAGSHVDPWDHSTVNSEQGFGQRISDAAIVKRYGEQAIQDLPLRAGSVLFFHDLLLHASRPNTSGAERWSLIPTYRAGSDGDDHHAPRIWKHPIRL